MSRVVRRRWISDGTAPSRRENRSCEYEAYVPDHLVGRRFVLDGDVAADVAVAEAAVALGILIALFRNRGTVLADELDLLKW